MKQLKIYIRKLKNKYRYSPDTDKIKNLSTKTDSAVKALTTHYCIEEKNVNTTNGDGSVITTITHIDNEHLPDDIKGNHLLKSVGKDHPPGKTSTLSNTSYFIKNEALNTDNDDDKVELADRPSILKRIDGDNLAKHMSKVNRKAVYDIIDEEEVYIIDDPLSGESEETPVKGVVDKDCVNIDIDQI